jgi:hypothetical protein
LSDDPEELEMMWFRVRYDLDQGKWRYWAGDQEVDHKTWQALQYSPTNPERTRK